MPMPPPTHMVSRPMVLSSVRRSLSRVQRMRAPVMPKGWPSAIAPPCGLRRSSKGSMPMPRADGMTCAAKASLISTTSTLLILSPARCRACRLASMGPSPMYSGFSEHSPVLTMRASGVMPSSLARVSLMTTTAAAPSLSGQAFPAVTVPSSRNTGARLASFSRVVSRRGPSSLVISPAPSGSGTGMISRSKKPLSWAATARCWLRSAKRSCSSRLICSRRGTFSAVWPMGVETSGEPPGVTARQPRVLIGGVVADPVDEAGDALNTHGEKGVALTRLDRVRGHARALQGAGAVPADRGAGNVEVGQDGEHPPEVEALLTPGKPAAADEVLDGVGIELRHLAQDAGHDVRAQVVGADIDQ